MATLTSNVNVRSEEFLANQAHMQTQVDDLRSVVIAVSEGGRTVRQAAADHS